MHRCRREDSAFSMIDLKRTLQAQNVTVLSAFQKTKSTLNCLMSVCLQIRSYLFRWLVLMCFFPGRIQGCFDALERQYVSFLPIFKWDFPISSWSLVKAFFPFVLYSFVVILHGHNTPSQLWDSPECMHVRFGILFLESKYWMLLLARLVCGVWTHL